MLPELKPHSDAMAATAHAMIDGVVWQTIALSLGAAAIIIAVLILGATDGIPLWAVSITVYVCIYLSYTALHEAVHQNITGNRQDLGHRRGQGGRTGVRLPFHGSELGHNVEVAPRQCPVLESH